MKHLQLTSDIDILTYDELSETQRRLAEAAREATHTSYSPYSHFAVGAAVLLDNGEVVTGSNQENVAYPSGLCAERTALFYAGARYPKARVVMIAIAGRDAEGFTREVCAPCGACRQVMVEAEDRAGQPIDTLLCAASEVWLLHGIESLVPLPVRAGSIVKI